MRNARLEDSGRLVYVVRTGRKNSRIKDEPDAAESRLVPTNSLQVIEEDAGPSCGRIIPLTPLRRMYQRLRGEVGSTVDKFESLTRIGACCSATPAEFLADSFLRSVTYFGDYQNFEPFVEDLHPLPQAGFHFAARLKYALSLELHRLEGVGHDGLECTFVDHEVSPIRTTLSCYDNGSPATNSGLGGLDVLLCNREDRRPIIGEIKAATETVGPTFALIQSLMYAAELVTQSQRERLCSAYAEELGGVGKHALPLDLYLLFETADIGSDDFVFMTVLATQLVSDDFVGHRINRIVAFNCTATNEGATLSPVFRTDQ